MWQLIDFTLLLYVYELMFIHEFPFFPKTVTKDESAWLGNKLIY